MTAPEPRTAAADAITRIDAELDRLRWYVAHLAAAAGDDDGLTPARIMHVLRTGDASFQDFS